MELNDDVYKDLLGICLIDSSKLPYIITKVDIDNIPVGIYRIIYNAIIDLYNIGVDVDIVTVSNRLSNIGKLKDIGGRSTINDLALNAPMASKYKMVVGEVIKQTTYRKIGSTIEEFQDSFSTSTDLESTVMDYCSKITGIVSGSSTDEKIETISSGADEVLDDLLKSRDKGCIGIDCGFKKLNGIIGGLQPGKMYIIGARPSMGKSALAMNIAEHVSTNKNVLFVSLEMSKKEYAQRLMIGRAGIDINRINTGTITDAEIARVKLQKDYLDKLNLFIETKSPCRVSDVELAIINLISTRGSCDLVLIDYLQLLTPSSKTRNRENEVAEMSRDIKSLAVKYNIPIIVLSQLSRALESRDDKRHMLSDLRESGAIEQDADVVMFVYRDEWYHPDDPASRGTGDLLIRKNRGGRNNMDVGMCWNASAVRFTEKMEIVI
jgi:replicative DNA helicase